MPLQTGESVRGSFAGDADGREIVQEATTIDAGDVLTATLTAVSVNSADLTNAYGKGVALLVNISALTGTTPSVQIFIQGKDAAGQYYSLTAFTALTTTGQASYQLYPGVSGGYTGSVSALLPRTWRVRAIIAGTTPAATFTVNATIID